MKTVRELRAELLSVQRELTYIDSGALSDQLRVGQHTITKLRERRNELQKQLERRVSVE